MKKSDVLFLIVGTNPMPNILSLIERVNDNGKVYLICSSEDDGIFSTLQIANNLKKLFSLKKSNLQIEEPIQVNKLSKDSMINEIENRMINERGLVEINYTGGTKLMSSTIYSYFKGLARKQSNEIILSYLDCEKGLFVYEHNLNMKITIEEEDISKNRYTDIISLKDIINSHGLNYKGDKVKLQHEKVAFELFDSFTNLSYEERNNWINELNFVFSSKDSNVVKENILNFVDKYISKEYVEELEELSPKEIKSYILGESLEEYIFVILQELKEENEIDDFIWSYSQDAEEGMAGVEIDFIVIRSYKTYLLSVTLCEEERDCKFKLYEAKMRSEQISGDKTRIGFICLYNSSKELINLLGEDEKYLECKVIANDNFTNIKEQILRWIRG